MPDDIVCPAPLSGYRVVDFSTVVAGPWCTRLLADCGAEVIKVESPGMGDVLRFSEPIVDGHSRVYAHFNCGKKNIGVDLKHPDGLAVARELIAGADIVVENFRPGVMARLGLDSATVARAHPQLIYCSISGFGQTGPLATAPAYAPVLHAWSGFDHVLQQAQDDPTRPLTSAVMVADVLAASYAFGAIQTAVVRRERFGRGSVLDVALMDSMLSMVAIQCQEAQSEREIRSTTFRPVAGRDGHVIVPLVSWRNWLELVRALDLVQFQDDPRLRTFAGVIAARADLLRAVDEWAAVRPVSAIITTLQEAGLPCARYRTPREVLADPALATRGSLRALADAAGAFTVVNTPFVTDHGDCAAGGHVAAPGEHTDELLSALGHSPQTIRDLRAAGVVS